MSAGGAARAASVLLAVAAAAAASEMVAEEDLQQRLRNDVRENGALATKILKQLQISN